MIKVGDTVVHENNLIDGVEYEGKLHNLVTSISDCGEFLRFNNKITGGYAKAFKVVRKSKHHKHRELIISWANGAEIEYGHNGEWFPAKRPAWLTCSVNRIKQTEPT